MGLASKISLLPICLVFLALTTATLLFAQKVLTIQELSKQRATLDGATVRIRGIFSPSHIGPLLKDETEQVAARLRFDGLPQPARSQIIQVIKDQQYRHLLGLANSIPDPDQPKPRYQVELLGFVRILKKPNYDVYKESPIEIYPVRVLRVVRVAARSDIESKSP